MGAASEAAPKPTSHAGTGKTYARSFRLPEHAGLRTGTNRTPRVGDEAKLVG
jgi:hypothetical protein